MKPMLTAALLLALAGSGVGQSVLPDSLDIRSPLGRGGMVELRDGRLMMVAAGLSASYSGDGGRTWSEPSPVLAEGVRIQGALDPVGLLRLKSGALALLYGQDAQQVGSPPGHNLFLRKSRDEGKTWSREIRINVPGVTASPYHDTLVQLDNGRLLLPVRWFIAGRYPELKGAGAFGLFRGGRFQIQGHGHIPEMDTTFVYFSDDEGDTWQASQGQIVIWHKDGAGGIWPCDEPSTAEGKDGRVLLWMRTTLGRVYQSLSQDGGRIWSLPQPTDLASSYSPPRLRRIPETGDLLAIWNQVSGDEIRRGYWRGRLSLAVSTDDGRTWGKFKTLHLSGGLEQADRIEPEPEIGMVRALKNVGPLPEDYSVATYPNAVFVRDHVFIMFDYRENLVLDGDKVQHRSRYRRLLVRPVKWLYER